MAITELVLCYYKPEIARQAFQTTLTSTKAIEIAEGLLFRRFGHVISHNGTDISNEYRGLLTVEWNKAESFHNFVPKSDVFQDFIRTFTPLISQKSTPVLLEPSHVSASPRGVLEGAVAHVFKSDGKTGEDVIGAWSRLVEVLEKEKGGVKEWSGWGIEQAEGTFAGIIGWSSLEEIDAVLKSPTVAEAVKSLNAFEGIADFVVDFTQDN